MNTVQAVEFAGDAIVVWDAVHRWRKENTNFEIERFSLTLSGRDSVRVIFYYKHGS